jgi:hypothetical protein
MFNPRSFTHDVLSSIVYLMFVATTLLTHTNPAAAQDCQTALASSSGAVALSNGASATTTKGVDEWDGEVVKITTSLPGVLVVEGAGDGAQSAVYTQGSSGPHPLIDSARLGTGLRELKAVIPAGTHCIQVAPGSGATGDFGVTASFVDACHLSDTDDHGDSFLCATQLTVGGDAVSGEIGTDDLDMFSFEQDAAATVTIETTGGSVTASLYDSSGALLGTGLTFDLPSSLAVGRFYVQISGDAESTYEISVSLTP